MVERKLKLGYGSSKTKWCEQLMGESVGVIKKLVENINSFFFNLSSYCKMNVHRICLLIRVKRIVYLKKLNVANQSAQVNFLVGYFETLL